MSGLVLSHHRPYGDPHEVRPRMTGMSDAVTPLRRSASHWGSSAAQISSGIVAHPVQDPHQLAEHRQSVAGERGLSDLVTDEREGDTLGVQPCGLIGVIAAVLDGACVGDLSELAVGEAAVDVNAERGLGVDCAGHRMFLPLSSLCSGYTMYTMRTRRTRKEGRHDCADSRGDHDTADSCQRLRHHK